MKVMDELPIIVVTLGLALPDKTWVERVIKFECDPEFENDKSFDLCETAMTHWVSENTEEADSLAPSGWWIIFHEWFDEQPPEERPDRPCDTDCARRLAGNDSVECTCSRSRQTADDAIVFKVDDRVVKVGGDMRVEVTLPDNQSIVVVLTHEGIITDIVENGEVIGTSSITYDERFEALKE